MNSSGPLRVDEVAGVDGDQPSVRERADEVGDVLLRHRAARPAGDHERGGRDPRDDGGPSHVWVVDLRAHLLDHPPVERQDAARAGGHGSRSGVQQPDVLEHEPPHQFRMRGGDRAGHEAAQGVADEVDDGRSPSCRSKPATSSAIAWIE